ncbi:MAG: serpin family protein [Puniceicoccales bacterium]|nr:serpin family protein [Puniceicoccales bacterium]
MKNPIRSLRPISMRAFAAWTALAALPVGGIAQPANVPPAESEKSRSVPDSQKFATGNNAFTFALYAQLRNEKGNVFFSPFSISSALAMTHGGARGETARQMSEVLRLPPPACVPGGQVHVLFKDSIERFNAMARADGLQLSIANSLWPQQDFRFLGAYLELLRENYGTSVTPVDYQGQEAAARAQINRWVDTRTQGKIQNLLTSPLAATTRLVLVNAVYFKGNWTHAFASSRTKDGAFYLDETQTVTVPLMTRKAHFRHHATGSAQLLELPYADGKISMLVMLPDARTPEALATLERSLDAKLLDGWRGKMRPREIIVTLPRFKITWGAKSLVGILQTMGIRDAFIPETADFSGMNGSRTLFLSDVVHKAFVDVNEQGTEAAAATAVGIRVTSAQLRPPPEFRADHPFLFLILENATGHILFMGRVHNPQ